MTELYKPFIVMHVV